MLRHEMKYVHGGHLFYTKMAENDQAVILKLTFGMPLMLKIAHYKPLRLRWGPTHVLFISKRKPSVMVKNHTSVKNRLID